MGSLGIQTILSWKEKLDSVGGAMVAQSMPFVLRGSSWHQLYFILERCCHKVIVAYSDSIWVLVDCLGRSI